MAFLDYTAVDQIVQFAAEQQIGKRTHKMLWTAKTPLLQVLEASGRVNKGFKTVGLNMVLNVNLAAPSQRVAGATQSNAFVALSPSRTSGYYKAQFYYARYESAFWLTGQERTQIAGNPKEVDIVTSKTDAVLNDFDYKIDYDLHGNQTDSENCLLGPRFVCATTNTVGNLSQSSYAAWRGKVKTSLGTFDPAVIDVQRRSIINGGRSIPDILSLSGSESNDVYGKLKDTINSAQVLQTQDKKVSFGFTDFVWMGLGVFDDWVQGASDAGSGIMLSSDSWYFGKMTDRPVMLPADRLQGTGSKEYFFEWTLGLATDDCGANCYFSGWDA